jgi:hypothetical protein
MKELRSVTSNISILLDHEGGDNQTVVEVVLLLAESNYSIDDAGALSKHRTLRDSRFSTTPDGARKLGRQMLEMADEAESLARRHQNPDKAEG